ncbi:AzlC family ABC transporter permease [Rhizobium sp. L1K21]|uniref:AzlC family ABC transporter permease n=1 Tax=Rhizobium sp. L1K21 TaxID=2954933 RepID=UPI002091F144|nr:AzlC family ABC transporter permease [Rhizobium sp. L1K21]MCO6185658.1 AzlC family ABC transporter permease [Rhizobium sp. L1K21]
MSEFWRGARHSVPIVLSTAPFGALFGAIAVDNGLTVGEATLMSMSVFAGASQIVGMDLFGKHVPGWLIVLSIFAVNFRHVLYSAALVRYVSHFSALQRYVSFFFMTDPQFAETARESRSNPPVSFWWYMGMALTIYILWALFSFVGAYLGGLIGDPKAIALDVLLPVYFLGLVMGFRKQHGWLPIVIASAVGSMVGMYLFGSPWHVTSGALVGVVVGALLPPKNHVKPVDPADLAGEEV